MGALQGDAKKVSTSEISLPEQLQTFYYGFISSTNTLLNTTVRGTVLTKTPSEFHALLEKLSRLNDQCPVERRSTQQNLDATSTIDKEAIKYLTAQMAVEER